MVKERNIGHYKHTSAFKENKMRSEPKFIEEVNEHKLPDVLGYKVIVTEWSDYSYSLLVYLTNEYGVEEVLHDGEVVFESMPDEDVVKTIIEEALER
jgi:hypothetical protein